MSKNSRRYDASLPPGWVYTLTLKSLHAFTRWFMRAKVHKNPELSRLKGPIIAIGNHPSFLDPIFMAVSFWPRRVHFLTTRSFFRKPLIRGYLQKLRTIPKTQFRSDAQAIKQMLKVTHKKGILGIYPEGQRSLDGSDLPIDEAIGKFIKKTGCTVVFVKTDGAYLSWPRWTEGFLRPGKIVAKSRVLLSHEQVRSMTVEAIVTEVKTALAYNEYDWQQQQRQKYFSVAPALGLQNLCHKCPDCQQDLVMKASRKKLTCTHCGYQVKLNAYGFFEPRQATKLKLQTPQQWHQWQIDELKKRFTDPDFVLQKETSIRRVDTLKGKSYQVSRGTISMQRSGLAFTSSGTQTPLHLSFPVFNRAGVSADFGDYFECILADEVYRFVPEEGQAVILFADAIYAIQSLNAAANEA